MAQAIRINASANSTAGILRVAAYCRVSSNSSDQLNSYATQIAVYKAMIQKNSKWTLAGIFADEGITGTKSDVRPDFQRMIRMCELKQIDLIITKSVSRFARNVKDALDTVRKLKLLGVSVMFEKEGINTQSMADEMLLNTFAALAQEESMAISQNLKLANQKRMADGDYINASVPYGFFRENGTLIPYEPEAKTVRQIYDHYLHGYSTRRIAELLNVEGIPTKTGKALWNGKRISYILSNEKNAGDTVFQKSFTSGFPFRRKKNRGEENKYLSSGTHTPIVSREMFEAVQSLLKKRRESNVRKTEITEYPFTGKLRCAECGALVRRQMIRGRERWCCARHMRDSKACSAHYVQTDRLESGFITILNNLRFGSDVLGSAESAVMRAITQFKMQDNDSIRINQEIAELNGQMLMLEQLRGKGYIAPEVYQARAHEISGKLSELKASKSLTIGIQLDDALKNIRKLRGLIYEITDPLSSFDPTLFSDTVVSGTLTKNDELTLAFIGGLKFTERI